MQDSSSTVSPENVLQKSGQPVNEKYASENAENVQNCNSPQQKQTEEKESNSETQKTEAIKPSSHQVQQTDAPSAVGDNNTDIPEGGEGVVGSDNNVVEKKVQNQAVAESETTSPRGAAENNGTTTASAATTQQQTSLDEVTEDSTIISANGASGSDKFQGESVGGKWRVNQVGQIIYKNHESYTLMVQIQMGIRTTVSEINPKKNRDLKADDFQNIIKREFPSKGSLNTPPHSNPDFSFYDYCPFPFRHLRERFGIDASHYLVSLCHDRSLSIIGTPGKSGALFFFSEDMQYILKTITKKESKFLRKILPEYYNHVMKNPSTLITRFYGLYSIKPSVGNNVRFVVMNNVFDTTFPVEEKYDLKGSTFNRTASEKERKKTTPIFKDLDFLESKRKITVGTSRKKHILDQLKADCSFLEKMKIMDYSLLLGIRKLSPEDKGMMQKMQVANAPQNIPTSTSSESNQSSAVQSNMTTTQSVPVLIVDNSDTTSNSSSPPTTESKGKEKEKSLLPPTSSSSNRLSTDGIRSSILKPFKRASTDFISLYKHYRGDRISMFQQYNGGLLSEDGSECYFFGIIDLLQQWDNKKQLENFVLGVVRDRNTISAVSPKQYAARFQKFMSAALT